MAGATEQPPSKELHSCSLDRGITLDFNLSVTGVFTGMNPWSNRSVVECLYHCVCENSFGSNYTNFDPGMSVSYIIRHTYNAITVLI